jgi:hypothetical protein
MQVLTFNISCEWSNLATEVHGVQFETSAVGTESQNHAALCSLVPQLVALARLHEILGRIVSLTHL